MLHALWRRAKDVFGRQVRHSGGHHCSHPPLQESQLWSVRKAGVFARRGSNQGAGDRAGTGGETQRRPGCESESQAGLRTAEVSHVTSRLGVSSISILFLDRFLVIFDGNMVIVGVLCMGEKSKSLYLCVIEVCFFQFNVSCS